MLQLGFDCSNIKYTPYFLSLSCVARKGEINLISFSRRQNLMDPQLQLYYKQSSPAKHFLDRKLQPLFKRIQSSKANSIHQLSPRTGPIQPMAIFAKRKYVITQTDPTNEGVSNRQGLTTRPRKRTSVTPALSLPQNSERIVMISNNSKVKKHLIDFIDFDNMETALFKKTERVSLFDQFYQTITQRDKFSKQRVKEKRLRNQSHNQGERQEKNSELNLADSSFRITQRKRFWRQERSNDTQEPYSHSLVVRGLAQSRTIDF